MTTTLAFVAYAFLSLGFCLGFVAARVLRPRPLDRRNDGEGT